MTQAEQILRTLEEIGGIATLSELYDKADTSGWRAQNPYASIRRIVQTTEGITKLQPGLYCLTRRRDLVNFSQALASNSKSPSKHTYYQAQLLYLGQRDRYKIYFPPQDRDKEYLPGKTLGHLCDKTDMPPFGYENFLKQAKTIDMIWFNRRRMPAAFYEVELTTDIYRSLIKFNELRDFRAAMVIVADESREREFRNKIESDTFNDIRKLVVFRSFGEIDRQIDKARSITS